MKKDGKQTKRAYAWANIGQKMRVQDYSGNGENNFRILRIKTHHLVPIPYTLF